MKNFILSIFISLIFVNKSMSFIPNFSQVYPLHLSNVDSINIIRNIADTLPNIDLIGHQVLLSNKEIIPKILDSDSIPDDIKKEIILSIIKICQNGDNFGTLLLDNYFHIVEKIL